MKKRETKKQRRLLARLSLISEVIKKEIITTLNMGLGKVNCARYEKKKKIERN